jgi:hypothetical protein
LGDDVVVGNCTSEKIGLSGGRRYLRARRPELYGELSAPLPEGCDSKVIPGWRLTQPK